MKVLPTEFCDYCEMEVQWDDDLGWCDIADGIPSKCEKSPHGSHLVTYPVIQ